MELKEMLYEGKAKKVFATDNPDYVVVDYKDDATAFNGLKKGAIAGKGEINNRLTNHFLTLLEKEGVSTHLVKELDGRKTLVKKVEIVPVEVIVRNIAAGSMSKRLGIPEGTDLPFPVVEYSYKNDELGDPMVNDSHILAMGLCSREELDKIEAMALKINQVLKDYLIQHDIILVDFKVEFGRFHGDIILADEISPDTCRYWDAKTREKLDKDRFRRDMGHVEEAYQEIEHRLLER